MRPLLHLFLLLFIVSTLAHSKQGEKDAIIHKIKTLDQQIKTVSSHLKRSPIPASNLDSARFSRRHPQASNLLGMIGSFHDDLYNENRYHDSLSHLARSRRAELEKLRDCYGGNSPDTHQMLFDTNRYVDDLQRQQRLAQAHIANEMRLLRQMQDMLSCQQTERFGAQANHGGFQAFQPGLVSSGNVYGSNTPQSSQQFRPFPNERSPFPNLFPNLNRPGPFQGFRPRSPQQTNDGFDLPTFPEFPDINDPGSNVDPNFPLPRFPDFPTFDPINENIDPNFPLPRFPEFPSIDGNQNVDPYFPLPRFPDFPPLNGNGGNQNLDPFPLPRFPDFPPIDNNQNIDPNFPLPRFPDFPPLNGNGGNQNLNPFPLPRFPDFPPINGNGGNQNLEPLPLPRFPDFPPINPGTPPDEPFPIGHPLGIQQEQQDPRLVRARWELAKNIAIATGGAKKQQATVLETKVEHKPAPTAQTLEVPNPTGSVPNDGK